MLKTCVLVACVFALGFVGSGCSLVEPPGERAMLTEPPRLNPRSPTGFGLERLPPPQRAVDVAVYQFPDLTGQNKPNDNIAEFSRAVTQGGAAFLIDALQRAGGGKWFNVVERTGLQNVLQERALIRATRQEFEGTNARPLAPMRFAGLLIEGGILAFDANTVTGGIGARYLGIGGDAKHRRDMVTVGMRVVSVQSGQVLASVTTTKTVFSVGIQGGAYRFVAIDKIFELEAGTTRNEPTQLAVREAIELAVYALIMEGSSKNLWRFGDLHTQRRLLDEYRRRENSSVPIEGLQEAVSFDEAVTPAAAANG